MLNKESGKRHFLAFPGIWLHKGKNCLINKKIFMDLNYHLKKINLTRSVLSKKKVATKKNLDFEKMGPKVKKIFPLKFIDYFL